MKIVLFLLSVFEVMMLKLKSLALILFVLSMALMGCSKSTILSHGDEVDAEEEGAAPRYPVFAPPPGAPGPFVVQLHQKRPSFVFGTAANVTHFAITYQTDLGGDNCGIDGLNVCFKGFLLIAERKNPSKFELVELYESDTQSGAHIDELHDTHDGFVVLLREGRYVGDDLVSRLVFVQNDGRIQSQSPLEFDHVEVKQASGAVLADGSVLVCALKSEERQSQNEISERITCKKIFSSGKAERVHGVQAENPVHFVKVATHAKSTLLLWQTGKRLKASLLENPKHVIDLGYSTAKSASVIYGHGAYLTIWQDDQGHVHSVRIEEDGSLSERLTLAGLQYNLPDAISAVPAGFLFAVNVGKRSDIGLIEPSNEKWHLLSNSEYLRKISGISALHIQNARQGMFIWQTADSLVQGP